MLKGNVHAALAFLDDVDRAGAPLHLKDPVLPDKPSWTVFDELQKKHPPGQPAQKEALLSPSTSKSKFHLMSLIVMQFVVLLFVLKVLLVHQGLMLFVGGNFVLCSILYPMICVLVLL